MTGESAEDAQDSHYPASRQQPVASRFLKNMPRLYLVRHARPAASWGGEDPDPGLDAAGQDQAHSAAQHLSASIAHVAVYSSPMRRCRETAAALSELWDCAVQIFPPVAEIPSPPLAPAERRGWLTAAMSGTWAQVNESAPPGSTDYLRWRQGVIESLLGLPRDCVVYTHFIAINVAVGAARGSDQVVCFRPDHAAITVVDADARAGRLRIVELGREAATSILPGR